MAYIVAVICSAYDRETVFTAAIMTAGVVVALTIFAFWGFADFTILWGLAFILGMTMFIFSILTWACGYPMNNTAWCALCVVLYGLYLIIDT